MKASNANKKDKASIFQVLLLDNDGSDDVKVEEADQVDFLQVKEHLRNGGSVFITSKEPQKLQYPKSKAQASLCRSRRNLGVRFHHYFRSP